MIDDILLQVKNVSRDFGEFRAVDSLDFIVKRGEVVGLLGPNGAGKTTTVRMLMGMLKPSEGDLSIAGFDCFNERVEVQKKLGYLPDEPFFQPYLRGYEILEFVAKVRRLPHARVQEIIETIGNTLELVEDLGDYASNYSQGMRKKMAYLMAIIHDPELILMDEPTNGLDPRANKAFLDDLRERANRGVGVLYSTHLLDQAERICDRCLIMNHGKIVAAGTVDALKDQVGGVESLEEVFFALTKEVREPNLKLT